MLTNADRSHPASDHSDTPQNQMPASETEIGSDLFRTLKHQPTSLRANQVMQLQRTIGNHAVEKLLRNPLTPVNRQGQIQRVWLKLSHPVNRGETWEVDTQGRGREYIKSWIDAQAEKGNIQALNSFIEQMQRINTPDEFETKMLDHATQNALPKLDLNELIGRVIALMEQQAEVEIEKPKTFAERAKSIVPQWIEKKPHGEVPKKGHVFVYRFTDAEKFEWQLSHLGKTARDKGVQLGQDKPMIPPQRISIPERREITEKQGIWDALELTRAIREKTGSVVLEAKKLSRTVKQDLPRLENEVIHLKQTIDSLKLQYQPLLVQYNSQYPNKQITATDAVSIQNQIQDHQKGAQQPQLGMLQTLYDLAGQLYFLEPDYDKKRELLIFYQGMPVEIDAIVSYVARYKALQIARDHFSGDKKKLKLSPFVSTASDYLPTATHPDKVMQSITRSDNNLEKTDDYDPTVEGRPLGYKRARHLVKYEIPTELLFAPEEVEQAFGMGSSETEGLVAMRQIKERLYLGDNIYEYMVAYSENPF